jgi:heme exporter protein A
MGYRTIFHDVDLSIGRGDVLAIIGPNGAGKTTLLRVLAGLLKPTTGEMERNGTLGLVAHHSMLYDTLTASENLTFVARMLAVSDTKRIDELLEQMGIWRWRHQPSGTFSRGMLQRLAIARALLNDPEILLLDEPLSSLDEPGTDVALGVFQRMRDRGRALVLVTHQFERVAQLATMVAFLVGGTLDGPEPLGDRAPSDVADRYRSLLARA